MNADVKLMMENVIQSKNEITISVNKNAKNQENNVYPKTIMFGTLEFCL